MEKRSKEAIVGLAFGLTDLKIYSFLSSLLASEFKGDVILFVDNHTRFSWQIPFELSIKVINIDRELSAHLYLYRVINWIMRALHLTRPWAEWNKRKICKTLKAKQKLSSGQLAFVHAFFFLTISRFFMYYNWSLKTDYDKFFFTDVNDLIFQGDIFTSFVKNKVVVYEEYDGCPLGNDGNNSDWVKKGYGEQVLSELSASTIYCAGTIMADRVVCSTFLQDFMLEILAPNKPLRTSGLDQGVLNYMVSHQKKDYFFSSKNGEHVFTVALQPENDILIENQFIVLRQWSRVPAVVHQYNRHKKLIDFIDVKYFINTN
jgi:hypothetical protein